MIQVVPVIVCDEQIIDLWHVCHSVAVGSHESTGASCGRSTAAEYRIHQDLFILKLEKIRGMPEPDEDVLFRGKFVQVGLL